VDFQGFGEIGQVLCLLLGCHVGAGVEAEKLKTEILKFGGIDF